MKQVPKQHKLRSDSQAVVSWGQIYFGLGKCCYRQHRSEWEKQYEEKEGPGLGCDVTGAHFGAPVVPLNQSHLETTDWSLMHLISQSHPKSGLRICLWKRIQCSQQTSLETSRICTAVLCISHFTSTAQIHQKQHNLIFQEKSLCRQRPEPWTLLSETESSS